MPRRQRIRRHLMRGLGHPVRLNKWDTKFVFDLMNQFRRQGRAARPDEAQRVSFCRLMVGASHQQLVHRRHAGIPGDPMLPHRSPEGECVEFSGNHHRSAGKQCSHGGSDQAMNVEQRHDAQRNVFFRKRVSVRNVRRGNCQVEMPQGNPLGFSRASAGVKDQRNVVRRRVGRGNAGGRTRQVHVASLVHLHREHRDLAVRSRGAGELRAYCWAKQNPGIGVAQKKMKLLIRIRGIQRGCLARDRCRQKAHDCGQTIG